MSEKVVSTSVEEENDEIFEVEPRPGARIRFGGQDEETGRTAYNLPKLGRTSSSSSQMSIASSKRRRASIDPATALPITYRTVSFAIEETKEKQKAEALRSKKDAAAELGDLEWHTLPLQEVESRLSTSLVTGLSREQVEMKAKEFGKNMPSKPPSDLFSRGKCGSQSSSFFFVPLSANQLPFRSLRVSLWWIWLGLVDWWYLGYYHI